MTVTGIGIAGIVALFALVALRSRCRPSGPLR